MAKLATNSRGSMTFDPGSEATFAMNREGNQDVTDHYLEMTEFCQELGLSSKERKYGEEVIPASDIVTSKPEKKEETTRNQKTSKIIVDRCCELEEVRSQILGRRHLPSQLEVTADVRRKEDQSKILMSEPGV